MFGMGFMEIFLVLIVAVIALGPEKLPGALVEAAKFFKKMKGEISDAKSTIDQQLDLSSMKQDAAELKASIENIQNVANVDLDEIASMAEKKEEPKKIEQAKVEEPKKEKSSKKEKISMNKSENA